MKSRMSLKRLVCWCKWIAAAAIMLPCAACAFEGVGYSSSYGYQTYTTPGYQEYQNYPGYSSVYVAPVPIITPAPERVFGGRYGGDRHIWRDVNRGRQSLHEFRGHQPQRGPGGYHGGGPRGGVHGGGHRGGFNGGHGGGEPTRGGPGWGGPDHRH